MTNIFPCFQVSIVPSLTAVKGSVSLVEGKSGKLVVNVGGMEKMLEIVGRELEEEGSVIVRVEVRRVN